MIYAAILALTLCATSLQAQVADLAPEWRIRNRGGSCGHCSTAMHLRWLQLFDEGDRWWNTYRGGEHFERHLGRLRRAGVKFIYTDSGDVRLIDYAIRSRRGAIVYDAPLHIRNFQGQRGNSVLILDNNLISRMQPIERNRWIRQWQRISGIAIVILSGSPPPPVPET